MSDPIIQPSGIRRQAEPPPSQRETQPANFFPLGPGGVYPIYRRNLLSPYAMSLNATLSAFGSTSPLRVLLPLADIDPDVGLAVDNVLTLICSPDDTKIVAMETSEPGRGDAAKNEDDTASLDALWQSLPSEIGGLNGLMAQLAMLTCFTGIASCEAVPGPLFQGVHRIWPVDSFTLLFGRHAQADDLIPYQRQNYTTVNQFNDQYPIPGYKQLNPITFCWNSWQPWVDEPYGRAMMAPAVAEVLKNMAMIQDLRDCIKHTAWPRGSVGVNTLTLYKIATEVLGFRDTKDDPAASNWVAEQFKQLVSTIQGLKSDDWIVTEASGTLGLHPGGNMNGIVLILKELELRVVRATKMLPVMMAMSPGKTETHTTVEWQVFAKRMEALRAFILNPILRAANLHLRLQGKTSIAAAVYEKIRSTDAYLEAQTESLNIANAVKKVYYGMWTPDDAAIAITGSGMVKGAVWPTPMPEDLTETNPPVATNNAGRTQEEKDVTSGEGG